MFNQILLNKRLKQLTAFCKTLNTHSNTKLLANIAGDLASYYIIRWGKLYTPTIN